MTISKTTKINILLSLTFFLTTTIEFFLNTPVMYLKPSLLLILIIILGFLIPNTILIFFSNSLIRIVFKKYKNDIVFKIISMLILCLISSFAHVIKSPINDSALCYILMFINSIIFTYIYSNNRKNNPFAFTLVYLSIAETLALILVLYIK